MTQCKNRLTISDNWPGRAGVGALLVGIALAGAVLAGCVSGPNLDPAPAAATTLAGVWKLDPALSDDPRKIFAKAIPKRSSYQNQTGATGGRRRGSHGGQNPRPEDQPDDNGSGYPAGYPAGYPGDPYGGRDVRDPLQRSPYAPMLEDDAFRSEVITIKQSPAAFIIDYGSSTRRLTPGSKSVVSDVRGVADQSTGWKGKEYVVDKRSQDGPNVNESYSLADGGKHLVLKMTLGGNGFPAVKLTRVYEAAGQSARGLPTND